MKKESYSTKAFLCFIFLLYRCLFFLIRVWVWNPAPKIYCSDSLFPRRTAISINGTVLCFRFFFTFSICLSHEFLSQIIQCVFFFRFHGGWY